LIVSRDDSSKTSENGQPESPGQTQTIFEHLERDKRSNHFYPTTGTLVDFTSDFFSQALGSKYSFQSYRLTFNKYGSLTKDQVLAVGFYFCGTGGHPPFYGNCIYGAQNQLRGYTAGRYFDLSDGIAA
jgi:outer membrane protein assembly factor BamA